MNFLILFVLFWSFNSFSSEISLDSLNKYYEIHLKGALELKSNQPRMFNYHQKRNEFYSKDLKMGETEIQNLFETDVEKIIENEDAPNLVEAKKSFYSKLKFKNSTLSYEKPYATLSAWHDLYYAPLKKFPLPHEKYGDQFKSLTDETILSSPLFETSLQHKIDDLSQTELTTGNKLTLLNNGENSFREKLRMVKESKKFFFSVVMVQYCDEKGSEIVDEMIKKAQSGVDVRLMAENIWTKLVLRKCLKKLQKGGVKVVLGKGFFNRKTLFTVHHSKFWIRDGEEAIIGGQNMHDFENKSNGLNQHTRDKDVHVIGPAVTDMLREYIRIWNQDLGSIDASLNPYIQWVVQKEKEERLQKQRGKEHYEEWLHPRRLQEIQGVCRVLVQGSATTETPEIISNTYIELLKNVKFSLFLNTPTLRFKEDDSKKSPNSIIIQTLLKASERGVKVDVVSNGKGGGWGEAGYQLRQMSLKLKNSNQFLLSHFIDILERNVSILTQKGNHKNLVKLLKNGSHSNVDAWEYINHIHSKQLFMDQILTSTGSFNIDTHSYKNHESTLICFDQKLANESMQGFISDISNSIPVL